MRLHAIALRVLLAAAIGAAAGCATMLSGTSQRVTVTSRPPGAEVYVNGQPAGVTPAEVVVSRRETAHRIRVGSETRRIRRRFSSVVWLDIPLGYLTAGLAVAYLSDAGDSGLPVRHSLAMGLVPIAVDLLTGAAFHFPDRVEFYAPRQRPRPVRLDAICVRSPYDVVSSVRAGSRRPGGGGVRFAPSRTGCIAARLETRQTCPGAWTLAAACR